MSDVLIYIVSFVSISYFLYSSAASSTSKVFILGMIFYAGLSMAIQDYYGKEQFVELLNKEWIDVHWLFGATVAIFAVYMYVKWLNKETKHEQG